LTLCRAASVDAQVRLVKMKGANDLFAMKKLKKSEMIKKEQVRS
jgi:hypothetical protein